jgi:hypothetical protein
MNSLFTVVKETGKGLLLLQVFLCFLCMRLHAIKIVVEKTGKVFKQRSEPFHET